MKNYTSLILIFCFIVAHAQDVASTHTKSYNGFYVVSDNSDDPSRTNPYSSEPVYFNEEVLIGFEEIQKLYASRPRGYTSWSIFFKLEENASKKLKHFTATYQGIPGKRQGGVFYERKIVLVIHNEVIRVANLTGIIKNGTFGLDQFESKKQAKEIIYRIKKLVN